MWRWVFFWPLLITGDGHGRDGHAWSPDRFVGTERSSITDDADTSCPRYSRSSMVCESVLPPLLPTALLLCTALLVPSPLLLPTTSASVCVVSSRTRAGAGVCVFLTLVFGPLASA